MADDPQWWITYPPHEQPAPLPGIVYVPIPKEETAYTDSLPCDPSLYVDRPLRRAPCPCCGYDGTQSIPKRLQFTNEQLLEMARKNPPPPEYFEGDMEKPF